MDGRTSGQSTSPSSRQERSPSTRVHTLSHAATRRESLRRTKSGSTSHNLRPSRNFFATIYLRLPCTQVGLTHVQDRFCGYSSAPYRCVGGIVVGGVVRSALNMRTESRASCVERVFSQHVERLPLKNKCRVHLATLSLSSCMQKLFAAMSCRCHADEHVSIAALFGAPPQQVMDPPGVAGWPGAKKCATSKIATCPGMPGCLSGTNGKRFRRFSKLPNVGGI